MGGLHRQFELPAIVNRLVRDDSSRKFYFVATALSLIMIAVIAVVWTALPRQVPLFFTYPWGEARLAPRAYLILLPSLSLFFVVVNILMGRYFGGYPVLLSRILAIMSLAVTTMLTMALFGIVQSII